MLSPEQHSSSETAVDPMYQKFSSRLRVSLASARPMEELRVAVAELVTETHRLDRQVEHAVAVLNRAWDDMPADLRPKPVAPGRTPLFEQLVKMTIETYYGIARAD